MVSKIPSNLSESFKVGNEPGGTGSRVDEMCYRVRIRTTSAERLASI